MHLTYNVTSAFANEENIENIVPMRKYIFIFAGKAFSTDGIPHPNYSDLRKYRS